MRYCTASTPCRIYIGNSADYTQNTQCGADQIVNDFNMFTCNLQGMYVTYVMYSYTGPVSTTSRYFVYLYEEVNFENAIIPKSAM